MDTGQHFTLNCQLCDVKKNPVINIGLNTHINWNSRVSEFVAQTALLNKTYFRCFFTVIHTPSLPQIEYDISTNRVQKTQRVAQSVGCLATDACLTADPGVASSIPARYHTFLEIDHEIISTVILLPSADLFKKGCCQLQAKVCAQITG